MNEAFHRADPASARNQGRIAISHNWIAMALKFDRQFSAAANEFRLSLQIVEQLAVRDPNDFGAQVSLAAENEELCKSLAYAGLFSQARSSCQKSIAINESLVKSDKNNVQAVADLASSNLTMGLALYLMHSHREALVFVERSDSMFRAVALRDPDSLSNGMVHAVALLYAGRIEASLHHPERASKNLAEAQALLEQLAKRSPKHRYILDALNETRQAIEQLPRDTAPVAVH
jgi:tetratricopeptide (TPR) repeat protein